MTYKKSRHYYKNNKDNNSKKTNIKPNFHKNQNQSLYYFKKFLFWFLIYFISISLLSILFQDTKIYQNKIGFYIIMGYLLVLISRIIYSATKKRELNLSGIVLWGLIYTITYGLIDFFLEKILNIIIDVKFNLFISIGIFSIIFTIVIMFLRRIKFSKKKRIIKAPSQIITGIILIIFGILSIRFSTIIFLDWFNWVEGLAWTWLIGYGFILGGILVLIAWWRNNVLQHRIGLKVGKW